MKWIFSSSFIHRVHIVHSIFTQSNQRFCMQPEQWLMSYYSTHSQGLMKKANNIPRVNAAKKESSHVKMDRFFIVSQNWTIFPTIACTLAQYCKKKVNAWRKISKEKKWNLRYWPSLMLFYGFMSQFSAKNECDLQFGECHSVWINCIIINTRGQQAKLLLLWRILWFFFDTKKV